MFVALDARDERIQIETHEQAVRLRTAGTPYRCPACREELIIRNGRVLPAHFAHRSGSDCVVGEPESRDHLLGKHLLAEWARAAGWQVDFEVYFSGIKQRADLVLRRPGTVHALEFQCAPLSGQRLAERTAGYAQVGVTVQWLLGPRYFADHPTAVQGKFETWPRTRAGTTVCGSPAAAHVGVVGDYGHGDAGGGVGTVPEASGVAPPGSIVGAGGVTGCSGASVQG
ncbi:competence protein CoiA [Lacticaseibacillus pantheris]|uniref:competence protein CoiA n=1 Tax=Lacticaseibacillus pantheris TaxID=171523 RepID=UPI0006CF7895|nr:competence protein CoiA family protein [Lacticaseibacillus pantheris]